jgi:hypothetical protein
VLAENERLYARLEDLTKQLADVKGKKVRSSWSSSCCEQMMGLQCRRFAASTEKRPRESEAGDSKGKTEPPDGVREQ